jgi:hypothetical protein
MDHGGCDAATLAMRKRVIGDLDFAGLIRLGFEGTQTDRLNLSFDALRRPKSAPALITRRVCHLDQNVGKSGTKFLPRRFLNAEAEPLRRLTQIIGIRWHKFD